MESSTAFFESSLRSIAESLFSGSLESVELLQIECCQFLFGVDIHGTQASFGGVSHRRIFSIVKLFEFIISFICDNHLVLYTWPLLTLDQSGITSYSLVNKLSSL